eukprot:scaffold61865_cov48-Phaeocystis_antarctica.AAC.2
MPRRQSPAAAAPAARAVAWPRCGPRQRTGRSSGERPGFASRARGGRLVPCRLNRNKFPPANPRRGFQHRVWLCVLEGVRDPERRRGPSHPLPCPTCA